MKSAFGGGRSSASLLALDLGPIVPPAAMSPDFPDVGRFCDAFVTRAAGGSVMIPSRRNALRASCLAMAALAGGCATPPSPRGPKTPEIPPIVYEAYPSHRGEAGLVGDSLYELVDERVAGFRLLTGQQPLAWGRYICRRSGSNLSADEFAAFRRNGLRPILILQPGQGDMSGGAEEGQVAAQCFEDSLASLRAAGGADLLPYSGLSIFLDVERGTPVTPSYLGALTNKLQNDGILQGASTFGIYINARDVSSLEPVIDSVVGNHGRIDSVWIAAYLKGPACVPSPYAGENSAPPAGLMNVATEMWQYAADCHAVGSPYETFGFDLSDNRSPIRREE